MHRVQLDVRSLNGILEKKKPHTIRVGTMSLKVPALKQLLAEAEKHNRDQIWADIFVATDPTTNEPLLTERARHLKLNIKPQRMHDVLINEHALDRLTPATQQYDAWEINDAKR